MNIVDFLRTPCATLPKIRPGDKDFPDFLVTIFTDYINGLSTISGTDPFTKMIQKNISLVQSIADEVVGSVGDYYSGSPSNAFRRLSSLLQKQAHYFDRLFSVPVDPFV